MVSYFDFVLFLVDGVWLKDFDGSEMLEYIYWKGFC